MPRQHQSETTLATFFIENVHATGSLTLFGSWDGFTNGYVMHKDRQAGHGRWHGCFTFKNIICDGNPSKVSARRTGALKEGGRYWYFYKKDGHTEFHNPSEPHTNKCPLLPGQTVNVWEIPYQTERPEGQQQPSDAFLDFIAMDARDRFPDRERAPPSKREPRKASKVTAKLHAKTRREWMLASVGRVQTAMVEQTILATSMEGLKQSSKEEPRAVKRAKSAGDPPVEDSKPLPSLEELRQSHSFFNSSKDESKPRSHFGARPAPKGAMAASQGPLTRQYTNPFLGSSASSIQSGTSATDSRRPSLASSMLIGERPAIHRTPSWTEGISDGHLSVRHRWRKLILNRGRPATAPALLATDQSWKNQVAPLQRLPPTKRFSIKRKKIGGVARHPNRISEVPELEAAAMVLPEDSEPEADITEVSPEPSPRPSNVPSPVSSPISEPSEADSASASRSASLIRKYSKKAKLPRISSLRRNRELLHFDLESDEERGGDELKLHNGQAVRGPDNALWTPAPTSPSDTAPAWLSPDINALSTPEESPADTIYSYIDRRPLMSDSHPLDSQETIKPAGFGTALSISQKDTGRHNFSRPRAQGHQRLHTDEAISDCSPAFGQAAKFTAPTIGELEIAPLRDLEYLGSVVL